MNTENWSGISIKIYIVIENKIQRKIQKYLDRVRITFIPTYPKNEKCVPAISLSELTQSTHTEQNISTIKWRKIIIIYFRNITRTNNLCSKK